MIWIDYVILGIIFFSSVVSLMRGFLREFLSLLSWACAVFFSIKYYNHLAAYLSYFEDSTVRNCISIILIFVISLITGAIVNYIINSLIVNTGLSSIDRVLGAFFGSLIGALIVSAFIFFIETFTNFSQTQGLQKSQLAPYFSGIIKFLISYSKTISSFLS